MSNDVSMRFKTVWRRIMFPPFLPPGRFFVSFYDKIHSVTGLAVAELKHLEHHMLQVQSSSVLTAYFIPWYPLEVGI